MFSDCLRAFILRSAPCLSSVLHSSKAINKAYEEYILSVGNLDERIFLGEDADEEIGTLRRCLNTASEMETAERVQMKYNLQEHFERVGLNTVCSEVSSMIISLISSSIKQNLGSIQGDRTKKLS